MQNKQTHDYLDKNFSPNSSKGNKIIFFVGKFLVNLIKVRQSQLKQSISEFPYKMVDVYERRYVKQFLQLILSRSVIVGISGICCIFLTYYSFDKSIRHINTFGGFQ